MKKYEIQLPHSWEQQENSGGAAIPYSGRRVMIGEKRYHYIQVWLGKGHEAREIPYEESRR